jgi:hypothetical protein
MGGEWEIVLEDEDEGGGEEEAGEEAEEEASLWTAARNRLMIADSGIPRAALTKSPPPPVLPPGTAVGLSINPAPVAAPTPVDGMRAAAETWAHNSVELTRCPLARPFSIIFAASSTNVFVVVCDNFHPLRANSAFTAASNPPGRARPPTSSE